MPGSLRSCVQDHLPFTRMWYNMVPAEIVSWRKAATSVRSDCGNPGSGISLARQRGYWRMRPARWAAALGLSESGQPFWTRGWSRWMGRI